MIVGHFCFRQLARFINLELQFEWFLQDEKQRREQEQFAWSSNGSNYDDNILNIFVSILWIEY